MKSLIELLETKRKSMKATHGVFSAKICPDDQTSAASTWSKARLHNIKLPKSWLPVISKLLQLPLLEVMKYWEHDNAIVEQEAARHSPNQKFSADQLRRLADIADKLGKPMTIATLLQVHEEIGE